MVRQLLNRIGPTLRFAAGVGAVAVLLGAVGLGVAQHAGAVRLLTVEGGSMAPAARYGALLVSTPEDSDQVAVGDVVSIVRSDGVRVTHRVRAIDSVTGALTTQGDANPSPDPEPYVGDRVDHVRVIVPWAGRLLAALSGPARIWAWVTLILVAAATTAWAGMREQPAVPEEASTEAAVAS